MQVFKLLIFGIIIGTCGVGIYWGAKELKSLNSFKEVPSGCTIVSIDTDINTNITGQMCNECNCNYFYNPFKFSKKRVCDACDGLKYKYTVTSDKCGPSNLLTMDNDYWNDKACGVELKEVGKKYTCYLYDDCRPKYSFDTMYADQSELVYPIVIIVVSSVIIVLALLLKCLCF